MGNDVESIRKRTRNDIFLRTLCSELSRRDDSKEWSQYSVWWRNDDLKIWVSENCVLPVEIHGLGEDKASVLENKHVQEIIQILHDTVLISVTSSKKKEEQSKQELKSGILTGSSVRVGYVFKKKPGNQICLVPGTYVTDPSSEKDDDCLRSFQVLREKLIVYAHLLCPGSPNKMSQLMKRVGDKRQSTGSGVSISSYFQKVSSQSSSNSQTSSASTTSSFTETTQTRNQSAGSVPVAPPSEGRRKRIKNIINRADDNASKRRHRKTAKNREQRKPVKSTLSSVFTITTDDSSDEEDSGTISSKQSLAKSGSDDSGCENISSHKPAVCTKTRKENSGVANRNKPKPNTTVSSELNLESATANADCLLDSKQKQVHDVAESTKSVCMMKEMVNSKLNTSSGSKSSRESVKAQYLDVKVEMEDSGITDLSTRSAEKEVSESCVIGNMKISQVKVPGLKIMSSASDISDPGSVTLISVEQMRDIQDSASVSSDSQADESVLPTASFLTRPCDGLSSNRDSDLEMHEKSNDTIMTRASPTFKTNKSGKNLHDSDQDCIQRFSSKSEISQNKEVPDSEQTCSKSDDPGHKLSHFRFKRKFPNFSDSDSDDLLPATKTSKAGTSKYSSGKQNKGKFVESETHSGKSKWYAFPKSLSESDKKKQTKLSFFLNKENLANLADTPEEEDMDITVGLMEELSQPRVKQEQDSSLRGEIAELRSVADLNEDHLRYLTYNNEKHLRKIFEGKLKCVRHDQYNQGGRSKRDLNHESRLGQFSDEQVDIVMECLMNMFCKRHHKYLDYLMKVLLPEMLIKLHMDVHGTSHEESEALLGQPSVP